MIIPWFCEVPLGATPVDGVDGGGYIGVTSQEYPLRIRGNCLRLFEEVNARHAGHSLIGHDHPDAALVFEDDEGFLPGSRGDHAVLLVREEPLYRAQDVLLVIYEEYLRRHPLVSRIHQSPIPSSFFTGICTEKVVPFPGRFWTVISPPCFFTMS